jgi:hypothetical protein
VTPLPPVVEAKVVTGNRVTLTWPSGTAVPRSIRMLAARSDRSTGCGVGAVGGLGRLGRARSAGVRADRAERPPVRASENWSYGGAAVGPGRWLVGKERHTSCGEDRPGRRYYAHSPDAPTPCALGVLPMDFGDGRRVRMIFTARPNTLDRDQRPTRVPNLSGRNT